MKELNRGKCRYKMLIMCKRIPKCKIFIFKEVPTRCEIEKQILRMK